jgi:hypothetical protein
MSVHNHLLFIWNVAAHLVASMSGVVSFGIAIYEAIKNQKIQSWVFFALGALFLILACDQAWQDEHSNVKVLIGEKSSLWQERDFWKDQSYQKDQSLRTRDDLLAKNYTALTQTQSSFALLSNRLLDVAGPTPRKLDTHRWKIPQTYTFANVGRVQFWTLVVTSNRALSPAKGTISCDADFKLIETTLLTHGATMSAGYDTLSPRAVHVDFVYPPLSAENPLVFFVFTKEGAEINECSFAPDK